MPHAAELWDLYGEWKRLTEKEGAAILTGQWSEVRACQRAKEQLQPKIVRLTDELKAGLTSPTLREEIDLLVRKHVNQLIQLESKNHSILEQHMAELELERASLDETASRLRKVHQSYATPTGAPLWDQYS